MSEHAPETCPNCGRPRGAHWSCDINECWYGEESCHVIAAAYRRGIDEGVRLAKERVIVVLRQSSAAASEFVASWNWTDVDKAAAAAKGERDDER